MCRDLFLNGAGNNFKTCLPNFKSFPVPSRTGERPQHCRVVWNLQFVGNQFLEPLWAKRAKFSCVLQAGSVFHGLRTCLAPWKTTFLSFGPHRIFPTLVTSECGSSINLGTGRGGRLSQGRGSREAQRSCHLSLPLPGMLCLIPTVWHVMEPLPEALITWHHLQGLFLLHFISIW